MTTGQEYLESLSNSISSTDDDALKIQNLMKNLGFPNCVVTCGIVYLDGKGTMENPPRSIHSIAKMILEIAMGQEASQ